MVNLVVGGSLFESDVVLSYGSWAVSSLAFLVFLWGLRISWTVNKVVSRGCSSTVFADEHGAADFDMTEFLALVVLSVVFVWQGEGDFCLLIGGQCFWYGRQGSGVFFGYDRKGSGCGLRLHHAHEAYHVSQKFFVGL